MQADGRRQLPRQPGSEGTLVHPALAHPTVDLELAGECLWIGKDGDRLTRFSALPHVVSKNIDRPMF